MKRIIFFSAAFFLSLSTFALPSGASMKDLKVLPRSEVFFTQTENCYAIEIGGVQPAKVQMDLPELPLGTKFISSKKEEVIGDNGERNTLITLWFTFAYTGNTRIPPLMTRINGRTHFFEFEPVYVYENPALISPVAELSFDTPQRIITDAKTSRKTLKVQEGEKIIFTVSLKYGMQVLDFKWKIPKDSIFAEIERFDFANGTQKISQFTTESQKLAKFEWQILREGEFQLPEIIVGALSYNGVKKSVPLTQDIIFLVSKKTSSEDNDKTNPADDIFASSFSQPETAFFEELKTIPTREDCKKLAEKSRRSLFDRLFSRKFAVFSGGEIFTVPEPKSNGQFFTGGKKVRVTEMAGDWAFVECKEFSGWSKNDNIFFIR